MLFQLVQHAYSVTEWMSVIYVHSVEKKSIDDPLSYSK